MFERERIGQQSIGVAWSGGLAAKAPEAMDVLAA